MNTKSLLTDSERRELVQRQAAEIARLTAGAHEYQHQITDCRSVMVTQEAEVARLHATLEEALTALATTGEDGCRQVLRAALAEQEGE